MLAVASFFHQNIFSDTSPPSSPEIFRMLYDLNNHLQYGVVNHAKNDVRAQKKEKIQLPAFLSSYYLEVLESIKSMNTFTPKEVKSLWLLAPKRIARY